MSLVDLIAGADERGLAASGLACSDRCVPLLGGDDGTLRPLWATLADTAAPADWGAALKRVRDGLDIDGTGVGTGQPMASEAAADPYDEAVRLAAWMLRTAPEEWTGAGIREWAGACSAASLTIHRLLDPAAGLSAAGAPEAGTPDGAPPPSPLVAAELRRQTAVLEILAGHGAGGLRRALEVSVEGRRVLRAVVSRRARGRG